MGKRRRGHTDVEELLARPWCYYCERDFEDLKLLISHQKAKHFKCERCGRRLNTAGGSSKPLYLSSTVLGKKSTNASREKVKEDPANTRPASLGLSVHMNQVHKETVSQVENALPNRQGLDVEIFGMEGVPQDILEQHRTRIIQNFYQAQESRRLATGNPLPGQSLHGARKKIRYETAEELLRRLAEWRAHKKAGTLPPTVVDNAVANQHAYAEGLPQRHAVGDDIDQLIRSAAEPEKSKKEKDGKKSRLVYDDAEVSPEERMSQLSRYAYQPAVAA